MATSAKVFQISYNTKYSMLLKPPTIFVAEIIEAAETTLLVDLVEKNLATLRGKYSSTVTNIRKQKIWQDITSQINSLGYEKRTAVKVREKWRNMTQNAKKIISDLKKSRRKTGGGPEAKSADATVTKRHFSYLSDRRSGWGETVPELLKMA